MLSQEDQAAIAELHQLGAFACLLKPLQATILQQLSEIARKLGVCFSGLSFVSYLTRYRLTNLRP